MARQCVEDEAVAVVVPTITNHKTAVHSRMAEGSTPVTGAPWTAPSRLFLVVIALVHVLLVWRFRTPVIATWQDDAEYVLLSREVSRGNYSDSWDVERPLHARYPPGYPAFLAAIGALTGERESVFTLANVLLSAGALLLFLQVGKRHLSPPAWFAMAAIVALNPELVFIGGKILSEPLFLFLVYLTLWIESRPVDGRGTVLATLSTGLTTLVRSAGLAVAVGLVAGRLFERRWKAALAIALFSAATGGVWAWYTAQAPRSAERVLYAADFQKVLDLEHHSAMGAAVQRVKYKVEELTIDELPTALAIPVVSGTVIDNAIGALVIVMLLPLGVILLWKRWRTAAVVLLAYGALYVVWPYGQVRLIIPATPLILLSFFLAAEHLGQKMRRPGAATVAVGALAVYFAVGLLTRFGRERDLYSSCKKGAAPHLQPACFPQEGDWTFVQVAKYAKEHLPPDAVVFTAKESSFYYHSARQTVNARGLLREDSTTLARALLDRGVRWVATSNAGPVRRELGTLVASACNDFELVKQFDARTMLLRIRQPVGSGSGSNACDALATWRAESLLPEEDVETRRRDAMKRAAGGGP
jgi:hypothetical protein